MNNGDGNGDVVKITLPYTIAEKIFGLYLYGTKPGGKADLSMFETPSIFMGEISQRVETLEHEDLIDAHRQFSTALAA